MKRRVFKEEKQKAEVRQRRLLGATKKQQKGQRP